MRTIAVTTTTDATIKHVGRKFAPAREALDLLPELGKHAPPTRLESCMSYRIFVFALAAAASASATQQSQSQVAPFSTAQISAAGGTDGPGDEVRSNSFDKRIPGTGTGLARVPADHVPAPPPNSIALVNPGFSGFPGLTHRDQRRAGTGAYSNTQFSLEPPDQGLCVGNGFVLELVNTAL